MVLSNREYKENDAIVTLINEEGLHQVYARGVLKPTSKNRRICQPFSVVEYQIQTRSNGFDLLMSGSLLEYDYRIQEDLTAQSVCFVLRDILVHTTPNADMVQDLKNCWQAFHQDDEKAISWAVMVLKEVMQTEGIAPYISGCIRCGRTDRIETISLKEGGFLCRSCNAGGQLPRQKEEIIQIYSLFHAKPEQTEQLVQTYTFTLDDFIYWANWIQHYLALSLKSLRFLQSVA